MADVVAIPQSIKNEQFDGKTDEEVVLIWQSRRQRMSERRQYYEPLWRKGLLSLFQGIMSESTNGANPLYNKLYEQYDFSMFSRDGLRFNSIKYPMLHAIVMRAMASEFPNRPTPVFISLESNDPTRTVAFKWLFNQVLYDMNADEEDFEILLDRRVFGTSIVMALTEEYEVNVRGQAKKKYKQCGYKKLDLRHVLLDEHCVKSSLEDCNYAQVDEYLSPEDFMQRFAKYPAEKVAKAAVTTIEIDPGSVYYNYYDPKGVSFIRVTHCFDKIQDNYHLTANDILLNPVDTPIPRKVGRKGKDIPLAVAVMYKIPGSPYGYGDGHVTTAFNYIKNLVRVMILEITQKVAKPLLAVDPLSNFDEQNYEWGQDFIRISPNDIKEIPINPDLKSLYDLDKTTDNDTILVTGININDTSNADAGETARKTVIRKESQNAIIELGMNYLSSSFFKRLYTLLKDDILFHYDAKLKSGKGIRVKTKGVNLSREGGGFNEEQVKGYRFFDVKSSDLDTEMELDLETGSISTSKELEKALVKESLDSIIPLIQNFDGKGVAKWIKETNDMPDYVLAPDPNSLAGKTPDQVAQQGLDPQYLPPSANISNQMNQDAQKTQGGPTTPPAMPNDQPSALPPVPSGG